MNDTLPPILTFRELDDTREEYDRLRTWLCNPKVREWYGADDFPLPPSLEDVERKYRVPSLLKKGTHPCCILADGTPVGYIQYYPLPEQGKEAGAWGVDLFIGEDRFRDRGIGTLSLRAMTCFLFEAKQARKILIDPDIRNGRAIRCYEKCGFRPYAREGAFLLMVLDRPAPFEKGCPDIIDERRPQPPAGLSRICQTHAVYPHPSESVPASTSAPTSK